MTKEKIIKEFGRGKVFVTEVFVNGASQSYRVYDKIARAWKTTLEYESLEDAIEKAKELHLSWIAPNTQSGLN